MPEKREKARILGQKNSSGISRQSGDRANVQNQDLLKKLRREAEEQHRRKQIRRRVREQLDELLKRGEKCETNQVLEFIDTFNYDIDLVREVLSQFTYSEGFPLDVIRHYISSGSVEELLQLLEDHDLLIQLVQQRDAIKSKVPNPLMVDVETTEQGPQFNSITPEKIQQLIVDRLGEATYSFDVEGEFPFSRIGSYPIQLNFQGMKLPILIQLELQDTELPEDCVRDFNDITPLPLPEGGDILIWMRDYLNKVSPSSVVAYYTRLSTVLVTAYLAGYGKSPWVKTLLREWRAKHGEYTLALGMSRIKEIIEQINHNNAWVIPLDRDTKDLSVQAIQEIARSFLAKDPVLSQYDVELSFEGNVHQALLPVAVSWRGLQVGAINLQKKAQSTSRDEKRFAQLLDFSLSRVLTPQNPDGDLSQLSSSTQEFQALVKLLKQEVFECEIDEIILDSLPANLAVLQAETRRYQGEYSSDRADYFLQLARAYGEQEDYSLLQFCLAEYCYQRGRQLFDESKRDARPYIQLFLFLYSQIPVEVQHSFVRAYYRALSNFFRTYDILLDVKEKISTKIPDEFYLNLLSTLSTVATRRQHEPLGRCLIEIAMVNFTLIFDLINRMKTQQGTHYLRIIAVSLQETGVFRSEPWYCLHILAQIDPSAIAGALSKQSLSTVDERRRIANALLKFACLTTSPTPNLVFHRFVLQATAVMRSTLAFALLVEPFVLNAPEKERALKASLIAEILGLPPGVAATEYFLGKAAELAALFDRFAGIQNPNIKGRYAITILDTVRSTRRRFMEYLRETYNDQIARQISDGVTQFFHRTEEYATAEQAKLIYDTTLEIVLVSDRTLHSSQNTRIMVEIRNVGEGIADHLELEVFPVDGKYAVENHRRIHKIDILPDKTPVQTEIFIQPLVGINESIDLSLALRYDTLKQKGKITELAGTNRSIWLYPASQFVRVAQPYNTGVPATTWFYGRQDELESMADNLRTGNEHDTSMIVYGLKRAGKTSVVRRFIKHTLSERGLSATHLPIYADLLQHPLANTIRVDGDFLYFLIEVIVRNLTSQQQQISIPFELSQVHEEVRYHPFETFSTRLEEILQGLGDRHLLLVLDEFSALYEKIIQPKGGESLTPDLFAFLSSMIQSTHQLTFIFTGTYMLLEMMRTQMYDLAKICNPRMITFLDDTSARQLVKEPVKHDNANQNKGWLEYDQRVIDQIAAYTHRHPYLIQYLCMQVVDRMNILKYHRVNLNDFYAVVTDIISKPAHEMVLLNLWNDFGTSQQKVLCTIAAHTSTGQEQVEVSDIAMTFKESGETTTIEEIDTICASLADAELLEKITSTIDQSVSYKITIPLYQLWLKQNKPLRLLFGKHSAERA